MRRKTRQIKVGNVRIGGNAPIVVQSMTKTNTADIEKTVRQIKELEKVGCEIVRVALPDLESVKAIPEIKKEIKIPLIGDVHFHHKIALSAIDMGIDGLRINPGNIRDKEKVKRIVLKAREKNIPIRIGVNSGSLDRDILKKYGGVTPKALAESALKYVSFFEKLKFYNIKISAKATSVKTTIETYRLISRKTDYPLHLGITEAGTMIPGTVKSSVGLGILLHEGIGDTIRVSLTASPVEEVRVAYEILKALGIRKRGLEIISCPICGRCDFDFIPLVEEMEKKICGLEKNLKIAVMGCEVNGPGEAREADLGIAFGKSGGLLFKKGKILGKFDRRKIIKVLFQEIEKF